MKMVGKIIVTFLGMGARQRPESAPLICFSCNTTLLVARLTHVVGAEGGTVPCHQRLTPFLSFRSAE